MTAAVLRIPIIVGNNENLGARFEFTTAGVVDNISGHTATFGMRRLGAKGAADLTATIVDGEVVVVGPNIVVVDIGPDKLDDIPEGIYDFEVMTTSPEGKKRVRVRGTIELRIGIAP